MSQGGDDGAWLPGDGSMSLYDAVDARRRQPWQRARSQPLTDGPEYYVFGAPGSAACAAAPGRDGAGRPVPGQHCLLAGPRRSRTGAGARRCRLRPPATRRRDQSRAEVVAVPQGTIVLQAAQSRPPRLHRCRPSSPAAQFFVLRDHVALTGNDITNPKPGTDQSRSARRHLRLQRDRPGRVPAGDPAGRPPRGHTSASRATTLNQHFAVALDSRLLTVPQIDFHQYPDGIIGGGGADVTGGFTPQSARDLATELRYGAAPAERARRAVIGRAAPGC